MVKLFLKIYFPLIGLLSSIRLSAQGNYLQNAIKFSPEALTKYTPTLSIIPHFDKTAKGFQYHIESINGKRNYFFDINKQKKYLLNDTLTIAHLLHTLLKVNINNNMIMFDILSGDSNNQYFRYQNKQYTYRFREKKIMQATISPATFLPSHISFDQKWQLICKGHNLYLQNRQNLQVRQLNTTGMPYYSFGINSSEEINENQEQETIAEWVPHSNYFYILRKDARSVQTLTTINSLTQKRPLVSTYKYALPGDECIEQYELLLGNIHQDSLIKIPIKMWQDQSIEMITTNDSAHLYFKRFNRAYNTVELCKLDIKTKVIKVLIHETSMPFINTELFDVHILNDGKDILWWSDRSGWGHWYHYNADGHLRNQITSGQWTAGRILRIDTTNTIIYFYGYGKNHTQTPYYAQAFSANINNTNYKVLTPENANHNIFIAPDLTYFVDNYSRIDTTPNVVIRNMKGDIITQLYHPDLSPLYQYGWRKPEMFTVKAKDDSTTLYGLMWKPFNFDSTKHYPIISQVYPGPQIETVWSDFTVFDRYNNTSLAQMGFVVVVMGHRGGSPYRNVQYYKYGFGNLRDNGIDDDKYGIEQLARKYKFIDSTRVGISGHSGGGMMAFAALGLYPDFYKAAVSSSGNQDNRLYNRFWGETYQGISEKNNHISFHVKTNMELASNIKGKLLLVAGESDRNVNPSATMRLVNALILADKQFEYLLLPGQSHHYEGTYKKYFEKRQWEFFYNAFH